jgi:hypothetical protein
VVQLSNGQVGLVMSVNASRLLYPAVLVYDPRIPRQEAAIIDLDAAGLTIAKVIQPNACPRRCSNTSTPAPGSATTSNTASPEGWPHPGVPMRIEIISTGDEIVTGLVVDTNAAWLSALLLEQGWQVRRRATVGDNLADLTAVLQGERQPRRGGTGVRGLGPRRTTSPPRPRPRRLTSP